MIPGVAVVDCKIIWILSSSATIRFDNNTVIVKPTCIELSDTKKTAYCEPLPTDWDYLYGLCSWTCLFSWFPHQSHDVSVNGLFMWCERRASRNVCKEVNLFHNVVKINLFSTNPVLELSNNPDCMGSLYFLLSDIFKF